MITGVIFKGTVKLNSN